MEHVDWQADNISVSIEKAEIRVNVVVNAGSGAHACGVEESVKKAVENYLKRLNRASAL